MIIEKVVYNIILYYIIIVLLEVYRKLVQSKSVQKTSLIITNVNKSSALFNDGHSDKATLWIIELLTSQLKSKRTNADHAYCHWQDGP